MLSRQEQPDNLIPPLIGVQQPVINERALAERDYNSRNRRGMHDPERFPRAIHALVKRLEQLLILEFPSAANRNMLVPVLWHMAANPQFAKAVLTELYFKNHTNESKQIRQRRIVRWLLQEDARSLLRKLLDIAPQYCQDLPAFEALERIEITDAENEAEMLMSGEYSKAEDKKVA